MSNLLCEMGQPYIDQESVSLIRQLRGAIIEPKLLDQMLAEFIWGIELEQRAVEPDGKQELHKLLQDIYQQNPGYCNQLFSTRQILFHCIHAYDAKSLKCCAYHCQSLGLSKAQSQLQAPLQGPLSQMEEEGKSALPQFQDVPRKIQSLFGLIELILVRSEPEQVEGDLSNLINQLTQKCSPCFHKEVLLMLQRVIVEQSDQPHSKKFIKLILENKTIYNFLYLVANSPCFDLKVIGIKFLNFFLRSKTSVTLGPPHSPGRRISPRRPVHLGTTRSAATRLSPPKSSVSRRI